MNNLLLKSVAVAAMALPLTLTGSAKVTPKPPPTFGGFAKGFKFSFVVTEFDSSSITGTVTTNPAPLPPGVPKFKVGQTIKFTIGPKGELTGTGFKIPFLPESASISSNGYATLPTAKNPSPNVGVIFKNTSTGAPTGGYMNFFTFKRKGFVFTTNAVTYLFQ